MKHLMIAVMTIVMSMAVMVADEVRAEGKVLLGERHVTDRTEKDTIQVGKKKGSFNGLQIRAKGSSVEFKRVVVHFENGSEQVFEKNRVLGKGSQSRVINLAGDDRFIDKVVFTYEARSKGWKGAEIKLFGVR